MSSPSPSSGMDEIVLLDKVLFRLGTSETDEALEEAVNKFLAPALLKLASPQDGVRKKVMELLVHVNKRIKTNENIRLPMAALVAQYQVHTYVRKSLLELLVII